MTLTPILVFTLVAAAAGWLVPHRGRLWFLLAASLAAIFWLQPPTPIRNLDFWLPACSVFLTVLVWAVTRSRQSSDRRATLTGALVILGVILLIALTRYADVLCCLTPTRPPGLLRVSLGLAVALALCSLAYFLPNKRPLVSFAIFALLGLFIVLKTGPLAQSASAWLRFMTGQQVDLAEAIDLPWLGFSFLAFRLLHVLRDDQAGKLPAYSLGEFVAYALFFPAFTAGPIDRIQRFTGDLRQANKPDETLDQRQRKAANMVQGSWRILLGVFKKFVLADSLAIISLNAHNAAQTSSTLWMWVMLYSFSLRIYLDFSGYTDVALGLGRMMDFRLPENFDRPYIKQNLTAFWNSWHMTLAQWFRAYYFNPLTRWLRSAGKSLPTWVIIFAGQFTTMCLIGLWHGVTWNFFMWGAWHGLGLFIHNRWSEWTKGRQTVLNSRPFLQRPIQIGSWLITFNYVTLGWVWFALPDPALAETVFRRLAGFN